MNRSLLHVVVPGGFADPARPSGGNAYDLRLCDALPAHGRPVRVVEVEGGWPWSPDHGAPALAAALAAVTDDALVLVDGLLASRLPSVVVPASRRLRLVVLVHLPAGVDDEAARGIEGEVLAAAAAVLTPSDWCRDWLLRHYPLDPARVRVARPGVAPAAPASGAATGALLTVGAVSGTKGQDVLVEALGGLLDLDWTWTSVGALDVDPAHVARLCARVGALGLDERVRLAGPLVGADLEAAYAGSDLLVLPSRTEAYGMVVTEALARGLAVVASDVGGVAEALGSVDGRCPGLLLPPEDPVALGQALRRWLTDPDLRSGLREAARDRRDLLEDWPATAALVADVVGEVAA